MPSADVDNVLEPTSGPGTPPARPGARAVRSGLQIFLIATLLGNLIVFWWKRPVGLSELFAAADWRLLALTIPLIGVDHVLGGLRYSVLFNGRALPKISLWHCMRSNWANLFMGTITPSQTGGGPAQIYILWRSGAAVADGMLASLVNFGATLLFFAVGAIAALMLIPDGLFDHRMMALIRGGFFFVIGLMLLVFGLLLWPRLFLGLIRRILGLVPRRYQRIKTGSDQLVAMLTREVGRFRSAMVELWRRQPGLLLLVFGLTIALFMNKYLIGYLIARALGSDVPWVSFVCLQICLLFLIYFAPTPGAAGLTEVTSALIFAAILSEGTLAIYTMLWRFATTIAGATAGALVLLRDVRRHDE